MEYMVFILWLFDSNSWFPIPDPRYPIPDSWILGFLNSGMIRKRFQLIWNHNIWLLLKNKKLSKPFNFWLFMANMSVAPIDKEESKNNVFFFLFFLGGNFLGSDCLGGDFLDTINANLFCMISKKIFFWYFAKFPQPKPLLFLRRCYFTQIRVIWIPQIWKEFEIW